MKWVLVWLCSGTVCPQEAQMVYGTDTKAKVEMMAESLREKLGGGYYMPVQVPAYFEHDLRIYNAKNKDNSIPIRVLSTRGSHVDSGER